MSEETTFEFENHGFNELLKAFKKAKNKPPSGKVGILGTKTNRQDTENTNASIGAKHELGEAGMPVRSFLRVPITENLQKYLESAGAFTQDALAKVIKDKSLTPWVTSIVLTAETIVHDAFDTGGFGKWKPSIMKNKEVKQTLVETQQLRNSITSEVDQ